MEDRKFELVSKYKPTGDQPQAIEKLTQGIKDGLHSQVLLGVTGSGKTFTMANVIANINRPTLVLAHNKTLAAQLCNEFRNSLHNCAAKVLLCANTKVGLFILAITLAIVKVLPLPVTPNNT